MTYKSNKDYNTYVLLRWIRIKEKAIEYLGGKCSRCGFIGHYATYEFHHRNPKEKEVSWPKLRLRSWDKIVKELDKCDVLCANCHSIVHSLYPNRPIYHLLSKDEKNERVCDTMKKLVS